MATTDRVYGVTPPISTAFPTDEEKRMNELLLKELRAQGTYEPPEETEKRKRILVSLGEMADEFVRRVATLVMPGQDHVISHARGRIFTYGSYRLGVYGPGSDMDTLVVAPKYVTVDHYFDIFPVVLREKAPPGAITDLIPVPDAFVPIIKFEFHGISIDLIFGSIQSMKVLPDTKNWTLADNTILRGLSESQVRSLNGTRVTDEILELVPEKETFRLAVRAIKLWAQRKAIYANILGYPGGIAWNIMVARVCQLYPKATSAVVVNKFFNLMLKWPWPVPVLLKDIEYGLPYTRVAVWNPKLYPSDRNHRMPIITPSYPSMCTTHNVGVSAMKAIQQEFEKGARLTDEIMIGKRTWKDLFAKHTFFTTGFKFYLTIISSSTTKEAHNKWSSFIESKVRLLVQRLDMHPSIEIARPFNKGYDRVHRCTNAQVDEVRTGSLAYLVKDDCGEDEVADPKTEPKTHTQLQVKSEMMEANRGLPQEPEAPQHKGADTAPSEERNGGPPVKAEETGQPDTAVRNGVKPEAGGEGQDAQVNLAGIPEFNPPAQADVKVYTTNHYIGLQLKKDARALDLSREVNDFKTMCMAKNDEKSKDKPKNIFEPEIMGLTIQHLKSWELPDDVFGPGEVKPTRPVRKKRLASEDPGKPEAKRQQMLATAR